MTTSAELLEMKRTLEDVASQLNRLAVALEERAKVEPQEPTWRERMRNRLRRWRRKR